jgi:hypothetical protein
VAASRQFVPYRPKEYQMYTATIVKDKQGVYHIRISSKGPQTGGDVKVIEILYDSDQEKLKTKAVKYVKEIAE